MPKCYLMIEDVVDGTDAGTVQFAMDMGIALNDDGTQTLPKTVEAMTPAQEAIWNFFNILKGMFDRQHAAQMRREVDSKIVMPAHIADEDGKIQTHGVIAYGDAKVKS